MTEDTTSTFLTENLILRPLQDEDLSTMCSVFNDVENTNWMKDGVQLGHESFTSWLSAAKNAPLSGGLELCTVVLRSSNKVIGFCGILPTHDTSEAEVKCALLKEYWGQGLAREAQKGISHWSAVNKRAQSFRF